MRLRPYSDRVIIGDLEAEETHPLAVQESLLVKKKCLRCGGRGFFSYPAQSGRFEVGCSTCFGRGYHEAYYFPEPNCWGVIKSVGPGEYDEDGYFNEPDLRQHTKVLFEKHQGEEFDADGKTYRILRANYILGILGGDMLQPTFDRVLVRRDEGTAVTDAGIEIPEAYREKMQQGTVLATGPGKLVKGEYKPVGVMPGDKVLFTKYGGKEVVVKGERLIVLSADEILLILEGSEN